MLRAASLLLSTSAAAAATAGPAVSVAVDKTSGVYTVSVDGEAWFESPAGGLQVCVGGKQLSRVKADSLCLSVLICLVIVWRVA